MPVVIRKVYDSGTVTLGTGTTQKEETVIANHGDIRAWLFEINADIEGTLTTAKKVSRVIEAMRLNDKNGDPLWDNIRGEDLRLHHFYSNQGNNVSESDASSTDTTNRFYITQRIDRSIGPMKLQVTFAAYSSMAASGATSGTGGIKVWAVYDDDAKDGRVERIKRIFKSLGSGVTNVQPDLPKGKHITNTYFRQSTEDVKSVTFSADGSIEIDTFTKEAITGIEDAVLIDGHQTGFFQVYHSPYTVTENTKFEFDLSSAEDTDIYLRVLDSA